MKKIRIGLLVLIVAAVTLFSGCSNEDEVEVISERFFAHQVSSILQNINQYAGRTIRMEGMFFSWQELTSAYHFVIRYLDDCCGGGGSIGFELYMGIFAPFPDDTWVEVTGVLEVRDGWLPDTPILVVTGIREMHERGQEVVSF